MLVTILNIQRKNNLKNYLVQFESLIQWSFLNMCYYAEYDIMRDD